MGKLKPANDKEMIIYLSAQLNLAKMHLDRLLFHQSRETINAARDFMGHPPLRGYICRNCGAEFQPQGTYQRLCQNCKDDPDVHLDFE